MNTTFDVINLIRIYGIRENAWYKKLDIWKKISEINQYNDVYFSEDNQYLVIRGFNGIRNEDLKIEAFGLFIGVYDIKNKRNLIFPLVENLYCGKGKSFKLISAFDEKKDKRVAFYHEDFETMFYH